MPVAHHKARPDARAPIHKLRNRVANARPWGDELPATAKFPEHAVTAEADDDTFTCATQEFEDGWAVQFVPGSVVGGTGFDPTAIYHVVNSSDPDFQLAATPGGEAVTFSTDVTAGRLVRLS